MIKERRELRKKNGAHASASVKGATSSVIPGTKISPWGETSLLKRKTRSIMGFDCECKFERRRKLDETPYLMHHVTKHTRVKVASGTRNCHLVIRYTTLWDDG